MSWYARAAIGVLALGLGAALLCASWPASAEGSGSDSGLSGAEAPRQTPKTGGPVMVSSLTDGRMLVATDR